MKPAAARAAPAVALALAAVWLPVAPGGAGGPVRDIGSRKQLLLDETLVESGRGVTLAMNAPHSTGEILLAADSLGERATGVEVWGAGTALREGSRTRLWYMVLAIERPAPAGYPYQFKGDDFALAYAESEDGVRFTRPDLGVTSYRDPRIRNVVLKGVAGPVWVDPKAPPDARYRTQAKGKGGTLHFAASPDGIRWRETHEVAIGHCDTTNVVFWDPGPGRYVLYTRRWMRFADQETNYRRRPGR